MKFKVHELDSDVIHTFNDRDNLLLLEIDINDVELISLAYSVNAKDYKIFKYPPNVEKSMIKDSLNKLCYKASAGIDMIAGRDNLVKVN